MSIIGLKKWDDIDTFFVQDNNPTEEMLRKQGHVNFYESCGPTSCVNGIAARGNDVEITTPGGWKIQPEEVATDYFNDSRNYEKLQKLRLNLDPRDLPNNRVPQHYPAMTMDVFGVESNFHWSPKFDKIADYIKNNIAVMLCLKKPGHYICVVAVDEKEHELIYRDPWKSNYWPLRYKGKSGFNRHMTFEEFQMNVNNFYVTIGG